MHRRLVVAVTAALLAVPGWGARTPGAAAQDPAPPAPGAAAPAPVPLTPAEAYEAKRKESYAKIAVAFEYPAVFAGQNKMKRTSLSIWQVVLEFDPGSFKARDVLGFEKRAGEWVVDDAKLKKIAAFEDAGDEKRADFEKKLRVAQGTAARLLSELGLLADAAGDDAKAKEHWKRALEWDDQDSVANENLGNKLVDGKWYSKRGLSHREFDKGYRELLAKVQAMKVDVAQTEESSQFPEKAGLKLKRYRTKHFRFESDLPEVEIKEVLVWLERSRAFFLELFHVPESKLDFSANPYVLISVRKKEDHHKLLDACPEIPEEKKSFNKKFTSNMLSQGAIATYADGAMAEREALHSAAHFFVARTWGRPGPWLLEALANGVSAAVRNADLKVCFSGSGSFAGVKLEHMKLEQAPGALRQLVLSKRDTPMEEFVPLPADGMTPQHIAKAWSVVMFLLEKDPRLAIDYFQSASAPSQNDQRSREAQYLGAFYEDLQTWKDLDAQWREWAVDVYRK